MGGYVPVFFHTQVALISLFADYLGVDYGAEDVFDLTKMQPYSLDKLYQSFIKYSNEIILYLPRNSDLNQIARYAKHEKKLEVAHYAIMGASKVGRSRNCWKEGWS